MLILGFKGLNMMRPLRFAHQISRRLRREDETGKKEKAMGQKAFKPRHIPNFELMVKGH